MEPDDSQCTGSGCIEDEEAAGDGFIALPYRLDDAPMDVYMRFLNGDDARKAKLDKTCFGQRPERLVARGRGAHERSKPSGAVESHEAFFSDVKPVPAGNGIAGDGGCASA